MVYTAFEYMYRDASNYKARGEVWLQDHMTPSRLETIICTLDSEEFFIAEQVGLPPLHAELLSLSGGWTVADHPWHSFVGVRREATLPSGMEVWGSSSSLISAFAEIQCWKQELSPNFVEWWAAVPHAASGPSTK